MQIDKSKVNQDIFLIFTIITLAFGFLYLCFNKFYFKEKQSIETSLASIEDYINHPSDKNITYAISKYEECFKEISYDRDCLPEDLEKFNKTLIEHQHIDIALENQLLVSNLALMDDGIYSGLMSDYKGTSSTGLFLKADSLVRQGDVKSAMPIYKLLFQDGERYEVSLRMRSLLSYYGCRSDFEIWGEYSERYAAIRPTGSPYPAQEKSLSVQEVIQGRIKLRNGEFVSFMPECPLSGLAQE